MKVLITGCFGLIGSRLAKIFLDKGYEVIGIDIGRNYLSLIKVLFLINYT